MKKLKTLMMAAVLAAGLGAPVAIAAPAVAPAAAPIAPSATAPSATAMADPASANPATADTAATTNVAENKPVWKGAAPVDGIGQPVHAGVDLQPTVTRIGETGRWLNNMILLPLITVISLFVLGLMLWVVVRFRAAANPVPSKTTHNTFIEVVWTLVPVLILLAIAYPSLGLLAEQYRPAKADALTVKVTGYQWYWGYEYPDQEIPEIISKMLPREAAEANGEPYLLAVDNRMVVPVGRQVKLIVTGADVIHSFAVPALWTKMDAVPGRANEITFTADKVGVYYGQCSELCGVDHAFMPIAVEVVPQADWERWVGTVGGTLTSGSTPAAAVAAAATPAPASAAPSAAAAATPTAVAPAAPAAAATN